MQDMMWDDSFNLGVDVIDRAHQRLMSIIHKMIGMVRDKDQEKKRWACEEGIKYFKSYTIKHFAEEEAYMRSIDHAEYEEHKLLHDTLRDDTLPKLEEKLEASDYSDQAVEDFLGVCMGWLTGHIMIEDRKIVRRDTAATEQKPDQEELQRLIYAVSQTIGQLFRLEIKVEDDHYDGEDFGRALHYKLTYQDILGEELHVIFAVDRPLVSDTVGKMLFIRFHKVNKTVISAMQQLSQQIAHNLHTYFSETDSSFSLVGDEMLNPRRFRQEFETGSSLYSLLFETELGYFALSIRKP